MTPRGWRSFLCRRLKGNQTRVEGHYPTVVLLDMNPLTFFAHVAFSKNAGHLSPCAATANLLIGVDDETMRIDRGDERRACSHQSEREKVDSAAKIGRAAALDFLKLEEEFSKLPERRFVDFSLSEAPTYISVRPPPSRTLPNRAKVWRLAQIEADKLRTEPLP
jgi:hypothetical protein